MDIDPYTQSQGYNTLTASMPGVNKRKASAVKRYVKRPRTTYDVRSIRKVVASVLGRKMETKSSVSTTTDSQRLLHNSLVILNSTLLTTTQGVGDPVNTSSLNRIGDKITLRGLSIRMMLELDYKYSDVTFRVLVVRSAKGDTPTGTTLWNGITANKMLDTFNSERFTLLAQKYVQMKAPNGGAQGTVQSAANSGIWASGAGNLQVGVISNATKMFTMYIAGKKLVSSGILQYENGSSQVKFFDYHLIAYAYSNSTCIAYEVGGVNDSVIELSYTDA